VACVDTQKLDLEAVAGRIPLVRSLRTEAIGRSRRARSCGWDQGRDGPPTAALIDGVWEDGDSQVHQRRGVDQRPTVERLPLLYPGTLRLAKSGMWRLTITIGQDQGCFIVLA
jgi:hypothetical protein